jgi:hypothetical protein
MKKDDLGEQKQGISSIRDADQEENLNNCRKHKRSQIYKYF